jgi:hemoglobin
MSEVPTLYEWAGGRAAIARMIGDQRFRFASLMSLAADDADLPSDPEFRAALVGYLEWGSRLAMHNSQPGADVAQQAPVPHWGWGVALPYRP